jgi:hypothetical protein
MRKKMSNKKEKNIYFIVISTFILLSGCNPANIINSFTKTVPILINDTQSSSSHLIGTISVDHSPSETPVYTYNPTNKNTDILITTNKPIHIPNLIVVYPDIDRGIIYILKPPKKPIVINEKTDSEGTILISDDGQKIIYKTAYSSIGSIGHEINVINSDGSENKTLTQVDNLEIINNIDKVGSDPYKISWVPGTHQVLFTTGYFSVGRPYWWPNYNLFDLNVDTGDLLRVYPAGDGGEAWPSPDAKKIVVVKNKTIYLSLIDGEILYRDIINYEEFSSMPASIIWAPDSSRFGLIISENNPHDNYIHPLFADEDASIWIIDASTGIPSLMDIIREFAFGVLSPNLEYVGFTLIGTDYNLKDTYISTINGSNSIFIASSPSGIISFSQDSLHFAYYIGEHPNINPECKGETPQQKLYIGSLDGKKILINEVLSNGLFRWINNTQFIFVSGTTLNLGDIEGNSTKIGEIPKCLRNIIAKDLDFS